MPTEKQSFMSRRTLLQLAGAAAAMIGLPKKAKAHDLRPNDGGYRFDEYEDIVNRKVQIRQVYAWPNIFNGIIFPNVRNGLNGFQYSYDVAPDDIQVVVQPYASANAATYDDYSWNKFHWGEILNIKDPLTGQFATRNQWFKSPFPAVNRDDVSMEGLQRRGVLFLT
jgi:hypothetical protein